MDLSFPSTEMSTEPVLTSSVDSLSMTKWYIETTAVSIGPSDVVRYHDFGVVYMYISHEAWCYQSVGPVFYVALIGRQRASKTYVWKTDTRLQQCAALISGQ